MTEHIWWRGNRVRKAEGPRNVSCTHCRKQSYPSRRDAKAVAKQVFPGERLSAYRCFSGGDGWHLGHPDVAAVESRARIEGRQAQ